MDPTFIPTRAERTTVINHETHSSWEVVSVWARVHDPSIEMTGESRGGTVTVTAEKVKLRRVAHHEIEVWAVGTRDLTTDDRVLPTGSVSGVTVRLDPAPAWAADLLEVGAKP